MRNDRIKKKYTYKKRVFMEETDATGNLYFTSPLRYSVQAFESFLHDQNFGLENLGLPIVHCEADFIAPAKLGEEMQVELALEKIGNRSFTILSELSTDSVIGRNRVVHVAFDPVTQSSMQIPGELRALLLLLQGEESVGNFESRQ